MKSVLLIGLGRFGRHMAEKLRALHSTVQIRSIRNAGYYLEVQP